jgi:hypothetical protein
MRSLGRDQNWRDPDCIPTAMRLPLRTRTLAPMLAALTFASCGGGGSDPAAFPPSGGGGAVADSVAPIATLTNPIDLASG